MNLGILNYHFSSAFDRLEGAGLLSHLKLLPYGIVSGFMQGPLFSQVCRLCRCWSVSEMLSVLLVPHSFFPPSFYFTF